MKSQTVVVSVALLALGCLLIPRGAESAGGIVSTREAEEELQAGGQLREESLDDPESEQHGLEVGPHPLGRSKRDRRYSERALQAGKWFEPYKVFVTHLRHQSTSGMIRAPTNHCRTNRPCNF